VPKSASVPKQGGAHNSTSLCKSITVNIQGVPLPFFLFQKLIPQKPKQLGQKFQQFSVFHEVPFHMRKKFFFTSLANIKR